MRKKLRKVAKILDLAETCLIALSCIEAYLYIMLALFIDWQHSDDMIFDVVFIVLVTLAIVTHMIKSYCLVRVKPRRQRVEYVECDYDCARCRDKHRCTYYEEHCNNTSEEE